VKVKQVLRIATLAVPLIAVGASGCNPCKTEILERNASPDGKWTATILTRDCGATTSEYMAVSVQDARQKHLDPKNEVFVTKHIHRLRVSWDRNVSLVIECENCSSDDIKKRIERLGSIQITYR
jgi:hypothetical protein